MSKPVIMNPIQPLHIEETPCEDIASVVLENEDLQLIKPLGDSRFPIFIAFSKKHKQKVAMKLFQHVDAMPSKSYLNEIRFSSLTHPNIVRILGYEDHCHAAYDDELGVSSYLLMELALCDLNHIMNVIDIDDDEKLARTFFHQLVNGLEHLHSNGFAHLDLKPENLLLGQDFELKITDFDMSYQKGDICTVGKGTPYYRAPEVAKRRCKKPKAADIYSAGIILFILKFGQLPYDEKAPVLGYDLQQLMFQNPREFWRAHEKIRGCSFDCSEEFKYLFFGLVNEIPENRLTINEIRRNTWFQGPTYTKQEMSSILGEFLEGKNMYIE